MRSLLELFDASVLQQVAAQVRFPGESTSTAGDCARARALWTWRNIYDSTNLVFFYHATIDFCVILHKTFSLCCLICAPHRAAVRRLVLLQPPLSGESCSTVRVGAVEERQR